MDDRVRLALNIVSQVLMAVQWVLFAVTVSRARKRWSADGVSTELAAMEVSNTRSGSSAPIRFKSAGRASVQVSVTPTPTRDKSVTAQRRPRRAKLCPKEQQLRHKLRLTFGMLVALSIRAIDPFSVFFDGFAFIEHAATLLFSAFGALWLFYTVYHFLQCLFTTRMGSLGQEFPRSALYTRLLADSIFCGVSLATMIGTLATRKMVFTVTALLGAVFLSTSVSLISAVGVHLICRRAQKMFANMPSDDKQLVELLPLMKDFRKRGFTLAGYIANAGVMFAVQAAILLPHWNVLAEDLDGFAYAFLAVDHNINTIIGLTVFQYIQWQPPPTVNGDAGTTASVRV